MLFKGLLLYPLKDLIYIYTNNFLNSHVKSLVKYLIQTTVDIIFSVLETS